MWTQCLWPLNPLHYWKSSGLARPGVTSQTFAFPRSSWLPLNSQGHWPSPLPRFSPLSRINLTDGRDQWERPGRWCGRWEPEPPDKETAPSLRISVPPSSVNVSIFSHRSGIFCTLQRHQGLLRRYKGGRILGECLWEEVGRSPKGWETPQTCVADPKWRREGRIVR